MRDAYSIWGRRTVIYGLGRVRVLCKRLQKGESMRPHGEHPTMGLCDCDECQDYDEKQRREKRKMKHANYRKNNDRTQNSSTYHKKDGTNMRSILKREGIKEIQDETKEDTQMKTVHITISDGIVRYVKGSEGILVTIRNYDIEDFESDLIKEDSCGDKYVETVWQI